MKQARLGQFTLTLKKVLLNNRNAMRDIYFWYTDGGNAFSLAPPCSLHPVMNETRKRWMSKVLPRNITKKKKTEQNKKTRLCKNKWPNQFMMGGEGHPHPRNSLPNKTQPPLIKTPCAFAFVGFFFVLYKGGGLSSHHEAS